MSNTRDSLGEQITLDKLIEQTHTTFEENGITNTPQYFGAYTLANTPNVILPNLSNLPDNSFYNTKIRQLVLPSLSVSLWINSSTATPSQFTNSYIDWSLGKIYVPDDLVLDYEARCYNKFHFAPLSTYDDNITDFSSITDTWDQIIASINNNSYHQKYRLGDTKLLTLTNGELYYMRIIAFDKDELPNGKKAAITWLSINACPEKHSMAPNGRRSDWSTCTLRSWLKSNILAQFPSNILSLVQTINKTYRKRDNTTAIIEDDIWIPSTLEMDVSRYSSRYPMAESTGVRYPEDASLSRYQIGCHSQYDSNQVASFFLRTAVDYQSYQIVSVSSSHSYSTGYNYMSQSLYEYDSLYIIFGFCLGQSPNIITDSWTEIIENENNDTYLQKYTIGQVKEFTINNTTYHAQIIAFNTDNLSDNTGKAKITWFVRLGFSSRFNSTSGVTWEDSEIRNKLNNEIFEQMPSDLQNSIKEVQKTTYTYSQNNIITNDLLWLLSEDEFFGLTHMESGIEYPYLINQNTPDKNNLNWPYPAGEISDRNNCWLRSSNGPVLSYLGTTENDRLNPAYAQITNSSINGHYRIRYEKYTWAAGYVSNQLICMFGFCT